MSYNVEADITDIIITEGDTINMGWYVYLNDVLYDISGMSLKMDIKDDHGNLIDTFSSGTEITIVATYFTLYSVSSAFRPGRYRYDIQLTNGADVMTIRKGNFIVQKQITT